MKDIDVDQLTIRNNEDDEQFEARVGDSIAKAKYELSDGRITFTHTEVPEEFRGQGIASKLVRAALDDVRDRDLDVKVECPFVKSYIEGHPEYKDMLRE